MYDGMLLAGGWSLVKRTDNCGVTLCSFGVYPVIKLIFDMPEASQQQQLVGIIGLVLHPLAILKNVFYGSSGRWQRAGYPGPLGYCIFVGGPYAQRRAILCLSHE
jgi:hypothetical protein